MRIEAKNIQFQFLLVGLFFYLLVAPFLIHVPFAYIVVNLLLSFVLLSALFTLQKNKALKYISFILITLLLLPLWINLSGIIHISLIITYSILSIYLLFLISSLLYHFFSAKKVTANTIYAALCLYLLIGILWGAIYALVNDLIPGSFQGSILNLPEIPEMQLHGFIYYSFTTLTTLGYGDIVPKTLQAAALCQAEAIIGQFFTSVLIAQLVGIRVAQHLRKKS